MQEQMNSMHGSGEFQNIESKLCLRLSHVSSQPEMIPSSRALLSPTKVLFFGNQFSTFDSPRDFPQRFSSDEVQRNREAALGDPEVKTSLTRIRNIRWMFRRTTWSDSKDSTCRNYNSTDSQLHHHFWCGNQHSKHRSQVVLIFPSEAMLWIEEVEMVDFWMSSNPQKMGKIFQNLRCWTRRLPRL